MSDFDFINMDHRDFAQVDLTFVIRRDDIQAITQDLNSIREAAGEAFSTDVVFSTATVRNLDIEVVRRADHARKFSSYMARSTEELAPLAGHVGGDVVQTGGGCLAIELDISNEDYQVLVADEDGPLELPTEDYTLGGRRYSVGIYAANGWVTFSQVTWKELERAVETAESFIRTGTQIDGEHWFDTIDDFMEAYGL